MIFPDPNSIKQPEQVRSMETRGSMNLYIILNSMIGHRWFTTYLWVEVFSFAVQFCVTTKILLLLPMHFSVFDLCRVHKWWKHYKHEQASVPPPPISIAVRKQDGRASNTISETIVSPSDAFKQTYP